MQNKLTLLMAQINPTVGAIATNVAHMIDIIKTHQAHHDMIVFPELALTGYPPEDLLLRPALYQQVESALNALATEVQDCHVIIGHPSLEGGNRYNTASIITQGQYILRYHKQCLPNEDVFDEKRYFKAGDAKPCIFKLNGYRIGLCICEDIWQTGPVDALTQAGIDILVSINASPFDTQKPARREALLRQHASRGIDVVYVNMVGGQDELVFDGQSLTLQSNGNIIARAPAFEESLQTITWPQQLTSTPNPSDPTSRSLSAECGQINAITPALPEAALIYKALQCGLRDYVKKNGFKGVLLGLSGGIDSALTLCIAVDTLGPEQVHAVLLPSRYTAAMSNEDALQQAITMGVKHSTLPIEPAFQSLLNTLAPVFQQQAPDVTEENLQARIRGVLLMALSNKSGSLLLTTSNKSEVAVGYSTLYGDMAGGFAVLKDVLKTQVYTLAHYRNGLNPVIPQRVIERAPSAELAMNQTDQDSLPEYAILDAILGYYMNERLSVEAIIQRGYQEADVINIVKLIKRNEYKRYQAAPGVKISPCAFGRDWRYPLTSGFEEKLTHEY